MRLFVPLFMFACGDEVKIAEPSTEEGEFFVDEDGDGYLADDDCDDNDASIFPNAEELCDGFDNNCNGQADEDVQITFYADADDDGFGNADITTLACEAPSGFVQQGTDCDDLDDTSYPGAPEICDEIDNNCNSEIDEDQKNIFYIDQDGDGFGVEDNTIEACDLRIGLSSVTGDCDDLDADRSPVATEVCDEVDNNCNEEIDEGVTSTFYTDFDEDNYGDINQPIDACERPEGYVEDDTDCQDDDTLIHPGAIEICDDQDNNCNGQVDEFGIDGITWYEDGDEDGFGDPTSTQQSCSQPAGYLLDSSDCNDNDENIHPNQGEVCDGVDEDCDGLIDNEPVIDINWFFDADEDGFGNLNVGVASCEQPENHVANSDDCDDQDNDIYPDAPEYCNGENNDCDDDIDEDAMDALTVYPDIDGDGYGDQNTEMSMCTVEDGYTLNNSDCDDSLETGTSFNPDQLEICDGFDNDCNGQIDEQGGSEVSIWYMDNDGDGFGDIQNPLAACGNPDGYVDNANDCDDSNTGDGINPDATEICDGIDNNCDDFTDDESASDATTWYRDADNDGFGNLNDTLLSCSQPDGYIADMSDCDDDDNDTYPDAPEYCNGENNDCDDDIDEDAMDALTVYPDIDGDGYGDQNTEMSMCTVEDGYTLNNSDCDDSLETGTSFNPDQLEICDGFDNDCNGQIDEQGGSEVSIWYMDNDGDGFGDIQNPLAACGNPDGYVDNASDCDDSDTGDGINPNATEICDGIDNNCDALVDDESASDATTWYRDVDNDTFGNPDDSTLACSEPIGYVADMTDCDDGNQSIFPGADELCNGESDDCDEEIDEDAIDLTTWYIDNDEDGFGVSSSSDIISCTAPDGYASEMGDCDDTDDTINPDETEVCDDIDNNCSDGIDEGLLGTAECPYKDCKDILASDSSLSSGLYTVLSDGNPIETWCDMTTDGGGWTLVGYSYNDSTATSSGNRNIYSLECGGGTFEPDVRGATSASIASVELAQGSTEIAFSFGTTSSTEDMSSYSYAWKFAIPNPSSVTFVNHAHQYQEIFSNAGPCVEVSVEGIVGDTGTYTRYTLQNSLGVSWGDGYPTGYGAANSCTNHVEGPFVTSALTGSHNYAWSGALYNECNAQDGSFNYNYHGNYLPYSRDYTGTAAIWLR